MGGAWRLLDTGPLSASENMALDDIILDEVSSGRSPNTIRFLSFVRPCVLVGYHQDVDREVRVDYCIRKGVEVNRRITGGGAVYFEPSHLGWELVAKWEPRFPSRMEELSHLICGAVIRALKRMGVNARFRPKNDIEVGGRKISGTGGTYRDGAFLFQGTLLTDLELGEMLRCLRIPIKKLRDKEVKSLKDRVTTLRWEVGQAPSLERIKELMVEEMGAHLGIDVEEGDLTPQERSSLEERHPYYSSDEWIHLVMVPRWGLFHSSMKTSGGLIRAAVSISGEVIQAAYITGDFFSYPQTLVRDIEARLKYIQIGGDELLSAIRPLFERGEIPGISPENVVEVVMEAAGKRRLLSLGLSPEEADSIMELIKPAEYVLSHSRYLLLPYCAKPLDCELRWSIDCSLCGMCDFNEIYKAAYSLGFKPITIINYEHLEDVLNSLKMRGEVAWIGSCCEGFYEKHYEDLVRIGLPALLITTEGLTCYDLGLEELAYEGRYEGESRLRTGLIIKLLRYAHHLRGQPTMQEGRMPGYVSHPHH